MPFRGSALAAAERCPHRCDADERHEIRHCVGDEGERSSGAEGRAAERRPDEAGNRPAALVLRNGLTHLPRRDDAAHGRGLRGPEQHAERRLDERNDDDLHEIEVAERQSNREGTRIDRPAEVARDQDRPPVPAVDEHARRKPQEERGAREDRADEPARAGDPVSSSTTSG
jgi:hypothetical protein